MFNMFKGLFVALIIVLVCITDIVEANEVRVHTSACGTPAEIMVKLSLARALALIQPEQATFEYVRLQACIDSMIEKEAQALYDEAVATPSLLSLQERVGLLTMASYYKPDNVVYKEALDAVSLQLAIQADLLAETE